MLCLLGKLEIVLDFSLFYIVARILTCSSNRRTQTAQTIALRCHHFIGNENLLSPINLKEKVLTKLSPGFPFTFTVRILSFDTQCCFSCYKNGQDQAPRAIILKSQPQRKVSMQGF